MSARPSVLLCSVALFSPAKTDRSTGTRDRDGTLRMDVARGQFGNLG